MIRKEINLSELVAFAVAVPAVLAGALLVTGLVAGLVGGWERAGPMVGAVVLLLGWGIALAAGLLVTMFVAGIGHCVGTAVDSHLVWVAMLLAVPAQCLYPPWMGGGEAVYAPLWNPPLGAWSDDTLSGRLPVRVFGGLLAAQLFLTGILFVFCVRGFLQYRRESDERMRMSKSSHRDGPAMTDEELKEMMRREEVEAEREEAERALDEAKKDEDIRNSPA